MALPTADPAGRRASADPAAGTPIPSGRHQFRWWDGTAWTASVADNGVVSEDAL